MDLLTISSSYGADVGDWDPSSNSHTSITDAKSDTEREGVRDREHLQVEGKDPFFAREPLFPGCFPDARMDAVLESSSKSNKEEGTGVAVSSFPSKIKLESSVTRPLIFPTKEIMWVSARVHPGEVPAQHTLKGILNFLMDPNDIIAQEMRKRFVFKIVPIVNPDGVYRGHFRLDQFGQNLNRYYSAPDVLEQAPIYAIKQCIDFYSMEKKLSLYLDLHAHASKRGCFIYGNVLDNIEDQVQNMLYCRLIALNTPNFDYEGCLFSREHMTRIDPGDRGANLTAEGSGRVSNYLQHKIVHSYTLECNYNCSKSGNEVPPVDAPGADTGGLSSNQQPASLFTTYPDKFTPAIWGSVGRACIIAMLDIRGFNPCSRILKSKHKTLSRYRSAVLQEVRQRKEYKSQRGSTGGTNVSLGSASTTGSGVSFLAGSEPEWRSRICTEEEPSPAETNMRKFIITNEPIQSSGMGYNRFMNKRTHANGNGSIAPRADGEMSMSSKDTGLGPATQPKGGRASDTFHRGVARGTKPATADHLKGKSNNKSKVGVVGIRGVSSTSYGSGSIGGTLRSASAAAAGTQAGDLGSSLSMDRAVVSMIGLRINDEPSISPNDINALGDGVGSSSSSIQSPGHKQQILLASKAGQVFFSSSGGGRNSVNYIRGSTPDMSIGSTSPDRRRQSSDIPSPHIPGVDSTSLGRTGTPDCGNTAYLSRAVSRGSRNIARHVTSRVHVKQQMEYTARPPSVHIMDSLSNMYGAGGSPSGGVNIVSDASSPNASYSALNDIVYSRPNTDLPLSASSLKLLSKVGGKSGVSEHISSLDEPRGGNAGREVQQNRGSLLSSASIPGHKNSTDTNVNAISSAYGQRDARESRLLSGIPRRAKLAGLGARSNDSHILSSTGNGSEQGTISYTAAGGGVGGRVGVAHRLSPVRSNKNSLTL